MGGNISKALAWRDNVGRIDKLMRFDYITFTLNMIFVFCLHSIVSIYSRLFVVGFSTKRWRRCITETQLLPLLSMTSVIWFVFPTINCHCSRFNCDAVVLWVQRQTSGREVTGLTATSALLRNNLRQVVHNCVALSPSSISWFWCKNWKDNGR